MAELGVAYVTIMPSMKGFDAGLKKGLSGSSASGLGKSFGTSFNNGFSVATVALGNIVSGVISKATSAITSSISSAIARVDTINNFPKIMEAMGYSADDARECVNKLSDGIMGLPTSLEGMVSATQKIAPFAGSLDKAADVSLALNNALIAGGKSTQIQANALEQYSQMLAVGKVDMQAWRSMVTACGGQLDQLSVKLLGAGHNQMDLYHALQDGTLTFEDFNNALVEMNKEGVEGFKSLEEQARAMSGGIQTALDNVQNRINRAIASIIDAIGQENISGVINAFSSQFANLAKPVVNFIEGFKSTFDFEALGELFKPLAEGALALIEAFKELGTVVGEVFGSKLNGLVSWFSEFGGMFSNLANTAAIDGLASAFNGLVTAFQPLVSAFDEFTSGQGEAFQGMMERIQGHIDDLEPAINDLGSALNDLGSRLAPVIEAAAPVIMDLIGNSLSMLVGLLPIIVEGLAMIAELLASIIGLISDVVNFIAGIPGATDTFFNDMETDFNGLLESIGSGLLDAGNTIQGAVSAAGSFVSGLVTNVGNFVRTKFEDIRSFASGVVSSISGFFRNMASNVSNALNTVRNVASGVVSSIRGFFSGLASNLSGIASSIRSFFVNAFNGIVSFVQSIPSRIVAFFSGLGSRITAAIGSIQFPQPHITWEPLSIAGVSVGSVPHIKWYEKGGFVNGATIIGAGEAGAEMILPKSGAMMRDFARAIEAETSGASYAVLERILDYLENGGLAETITASAPTSTSRETRRMMAKVVGYA